MTQPDPTATEDASANLSAGTEAVADAIVEASEAEGHQRFATVRTPTTAEFNREEKRKDNDLRRHLIKFAAYLIFGGTVAALAYGMILGAGSDNADTRREGFSLVVAIVTAFLGALAGFGAGRIGK